QQPSCLPGSSLVIEGGFTFGATLSTMIYTPCSISLGSSTKLRGQVYAGGASIAGAAQLAYVPVGLPGVDLSTGANDDDDPANKPKRQLVSVRNVSNSGG